VVVFDIDHFKRFNDTYGHQVGDEVLRHVAALAAASIRGEDAAGRVGGEEFVLLLPGQDAGRAADAAERLRRAIESTPLRSEAGDLAVTVSGGVAVFPEDGEGWDPLFAAADERLYEAKRAGRNRIVTAGVAA